MPIITLFGSNGGTGRTTIMATLTLGFLPSTSSMQRKTNRGYGYER